MHVPPSALRPWRFWYGGMGVTLVVGFETECALQRLLSHDGAQRAADVGVQLLLRWRSSSSMFHHQSSARANYYGRGVLYGRTGVT